MVAELIKSVISRLVSPQNRKATPLWMTFHVDNGLLFGFYNLKRLYKLAL